MDISTLETQNPQQRPFHENRLIHGLYESFRFWAPKHSNNYVEYFSTIFDIFGPIFVTFEGRESLGVLKTPSIKSSRILNKDCLKENKEIHNVKITPLCSLTEKIMQFLAFGPFSSFWPTLLSRGWSQLTTQWHNPKPQKHSLGVFNDKRKFNDQQKHMQSSGAVKHSQLLSGLSYWEVHWNDHIELVWTGLDQLATSMYTRTH